MTDEDWRFELEDLEDAEDAADAESGSESEWGELRSGRIEPGSPSLENVLFVLLGTLATLFVIVRVTAFVV